jgi:predicted aspartyl protease
MAKGWKKQRQNTMPARSILVPKEQFTALTIKFNGLSNRIITAVKLTPAFDPKDHPGKSPFELVEKNALWDTGATGSVLTKATVKELNLTPVGTTTINHAGGASQSNTYLVNFFLPNHVAIIGVLVSECDDVAGNFGAIIGMDIIGKGDFAITNFGGQTWMSYRYPSIRSIDYVEEYNHPRNHRR